MLTPRQIREDIRKGTYQPHAYLSDMAIAMWSKMPYVGKSMFPICPVDEETGYYYYWNKEDLSRMQMSDKPMFGKVTPVDMKLSEDTYATKVKQVIFGLDDFSTNNFKKTNVDPKKARARFIAQQVNIYLDYILADKFFKAGVWTEQWAGVNAAPIANQFYKFDDANSDPVGTMDEAKETISLAGLVEPNTLILGYDVYKVLKNHPDIVERVKFNGMTGNTPIKVSESTLAQLFDIDRVIVAKSVYNAAAKGAAYDGQFIFNSKAALMCYVTPSPSIEEPSAGYTFAWNFDGNDFMSIGEYEGEGGTHSTFLEGLVSFDPKITCQDLGLYMTASVA